MGEPFEKMNLPRFEPYQMKPVNVNLNTAALSFNMHMTNIVIHGFSGFIIDKIFFDPLKLTATLLIRIPDIYVTLNYKSAGKIFGFVLPDEGSFSAAFSKFL